MDKAEYAKLRDRAVAAGVALREATEQLNEALREAERCFAHHIGFGTGRVRIVFQIDPKERPPRRPPPYPVYFTYQDGEFYVESGRPGSHREMVPLLRSSRELRVLCARLLPDLWKKLGGTVPNERDVRWKLG